MSTACVPWWSSKFGEMAKGTQIKVASGCAVASNGNIPCAPEAMRAAAEAKMRQLGLLSSVSLETYTLARYMQSEVGSGSIFERVAVGEAAVNRARMERLSRGVLSLLLYRQSPSSPNYGFYGPIHGVGTGVSTAPYGRWAATSQDPTALTLMLADLIMSGASGNFNRGADDQAGPEYWAPQGQTALNNYVRNLASKGKYWVGPIVGVDPWHTFLTFTPGVKASSTEGQVLIARGMQALQLPIVRPQWNMAALPSCGSGPAESSAMIAIGVVGVLAGMWAFTRRLFRGIAK